MEEHSCIRLPWVRCGAVSSLYCPASLCACRDDEIEHVKTMHACQDPEKIASDLRAMRNGNGSS
jgi:hypothetical protein